MNKLPEIYQHLALRKVIFCLILAFSVPVFAQSGMAYFFEQGNQAYRQENYREAVDWYQKILEKGYAGSQVYYNLGNCYYKLNDIGNAVLFYEKARKFKPDDPDILFNLELANLKVKDRIEMPKPFFLFKWWDGIKQMFSLAGWTWLTVSLYGATVLLLIIFLFSQSTFFRKIIRVGMITFGCLALLSAYLLFINIQAEKNHRQAVVLTSTVNVLSAPEESSTDVFVLHEGAKVTLAEQRGDWVKIALPDGKSGWLRQDYLGII